MSDIKEHGKINEDSKSKIDTAEKSGHVVFYYHLQQSCMCDHLCLETTFISKMCQVPAFQRPKITFSWARQGWIQDFPKGGGGANEGKGEWGVSPPTQSREAFAIIVCD